MQNDVPRLELAGPYMNAAGSLGFVPKAAQPAWPPLAAFVTNPISLQPRRTSQGTRLLTFPGGVLLHTGWPNPGLRRAVQQHAAAWARASQSIILNLLIDEPASLAQVMPHLEALDNLAGLELSIAADASAQLAGELVRAAQSKWPLIAQLSLARAEELATACLAAGASAISLGPLRGSLPDARGRLVSGRLYGPALYPQALAVTQALQRAGAPVIAAGGVETAQQAEAFLAAGALAVQVDVALWK